MKAKYPVEPFAVAFIMFTASMQQAVIVGIMLLAASCVGCVLRRWSACARILQM